MSYDIYMRYKDGRGLIVPSHEDGGTYQLGGNDHGWLNITYNYSYFYYKEIDSKLGIRWLYHKDGATCQPVLEKAIEALGTRKEDDYWLPTPGNAGYALSRLLEWCKLHPEAIFEGD